jgi:hypothetical protein
MTGTNCDFFTQNQSRSYLNHLVHALITLTLDTAAWADSRPKCFTLRKLAAGICRMESRAGKDVLEERKTEDLILLVRDAISTGNYRSVITAKHR